MLKEKMYVRFASDYEDEINPRIFICGQISSIDSFKETAQINIYDPFNNIQYFPNLKRNTVEVSLSDLEHCTLFDKSRVVYGTSEFEVITNAKGEDEYRYYYLQNIKTKKIVCVCESKIIASFDNGKISAAKQLMNFEFQNPAWYMCRNVVSKNLNVLDNSIVGFKDLAGCKIFLLPHQVNTIMRCLQDDECRYMLADEVGMGKTIEALSIYKLHIKNKYKAKSLILVPDSLKEQWKIEMFLKFNILPGEDKSNNLLVLKSPSELTREEMATHWDFMIVDEVHNYLNSQYYNALHNMSRNAKNVLLLSATPVQQREEEYLSLLRLLSPQKYDSISLSEFKNLIGKQKSIIQQVSNTLGDIEDYHEEIEAVLDAGDEPEDSDDCLDMFEEIKEEIEDLAEMIDDDNLEELIEQIDFDSDGYGINECKAVLSYICSNFQVENSIIRNRRRILENEDDDDHVTPVRKLVELSYELDVDKNSYETTAYKNLVSWLKVNRDTNKSFVDDYVRPLFSTMFSSVFAYEKALKNIEIDDYTLMQDLKNWLSDEKYIISHINDILDDPDTNENLYNNRMVKLLNFIYEDITDEKLVLFTDYKETFEVYKKVLIDVFGEDKVCSFAKTQTSDVNELNVYKFQNDKEANILLCDSSGGEGRNFQCADYVIHIDLPWDANVIEQRIGRLDRLERDVNRPDVYSVVIYAENTFENELFNFWNKGLNVFQKSLSGMEIIMKDINNEIHAALEIDIQYQLAERIPDIIKLSNDLTEKINQERDFDITSLLYRPIFVELKKLITFYSENENSLFTKAMSSWASMAGFNGTYDKGVISYSPKRFSIKSAQKSLLMPPKFDEYMLSSQNQFITKVTNMYNKGTTNSDRTIRGTFERKRAIENDYLHFFAPGDAIFDCIVENAMNTCKGQASAFAIESKYNWKGFIFTFKLTPDTIKVLKENQSIYLLNSYRTYLCNDLISVAIPLENREEIPEEAILRELNNFISQKDARNSTVSFGKRGKSAKFLSSVITGDTNIEWFKQTFNKELWEQLVAKSYKSALQTAKKRFLSKSNIAGAKEEMMRQLSSRKANLGYYGIDDDSIELLEKQNKVVLDVIKSAKVTLDSACFIWMVK